jgi:hypothetical protein
VAAELLQVDPRTLRLPWSRRDGAEPIEFSRQLSLYGDKTDGMLPIEVTRGKGGLLRINDGVTRATRVAKLLPGQTVTVLVTEDRPKADFSKNPTVGDKLP